MKTKLREHFEAELRESVRAERDGDVPRAWRHLERAHVLSQAHAGPHVRSHVRMLAFAWRRADLHELWGQALRVLVAAPGSWLGRAPRGNTGGARVGIMERMEIPRDLRAMLEE